MARERKTLDVAYLRETINDRIKREENPEVRKALCYVLSDLLMHADRYRGFWYLNGWTGTEVYDHQYY